MTSLIQGHFLLTVKNMPLRGASKIEFCYAYLGVLHGMMLLASSIHFLKDSKRNIAELCLQHFYSSQDADLIHCLFISEEMGTYSLKILKL